MMPLPGGMNNFDLKEMSDFIKQIEAAKKTNVVGNLQANTTSGYHDYTASAPVDVLDMKNLVGIKDLMGNVNQVMKGKFFLCRTMTPSSKTLTGGAVEVGVEDPEGNRAIGLALHKYSDKANHPVTDFEGVVPKGAYLVVKNPWFTPTPTVDGEGVILRCDNPGNVEMISEKEVKDKYPDCKWGSAVVGEGSSNFFWDQMNLASYSDKERAKKLKDIGNMAWVEKRFTDAIRWYKMGLDYAEEQGDRFTILNNMTAALMGLECWNAALKCVEEALKINEKDEKALYRKVKCLIGLEKWDQTVNFLEGLRTDTDGYNANFKILLEEAKGLKKLSENPELLKKNWIRSKHQNIKEPLVTLVGPISITSIEGKGRGVVATQPISPGQTVFISKPFAAVSKPAEQFSNPALAQFKGVNPCHDDLVSLIANKIHFDPELKKELYSLTAGKELGHLSDNSEAEHPVDLQRIHKIIKMNSFGTGQNVKTKVYEDGLWVLPSFINHSCSEVNCTRTFIGNEFMIIMAVKKIEVGEELLIPYVNMNRLFEQRLVSCQLHEFACTCRLCLLDQEEGSALQDRRKQLIHLIETLGGKQELFRNPYKLQQAVKAIEELYTMTSSSTPELNLPLLHESLIGVDEALFMSGRDKECFSILLKMLLVAEQNPCMYETQFEILLNLLSCSVALGDRKGVKNYAEKIKTHLLTFYGTLEPMKWNAGHLLPDLKIRFNVGLFSGIK